MLLLRGFSVENDIERYGDEAYHAEWRLKP
jgi:hypothetical protein